MLLDELCDLIAAKVSSLNEFWKRSLVVFFQQLRKLR